MYGCRMPWMAARNSPWATRSASTCRRVQPACCRIEQDQAMSAADIPAPSERLVVAQALVRKRWLKSRYSLVGPAVVIISLFGILPLTIMVIYSFLKAGDYGGVQWIGSVQAYVSFLFQRDIFDGTLTFSDDYLVIY